MRPLWNEETTNLFAKMNGPSELLGEPRRGTRYPNSAKFQVPSSKFRVPSSEFQVPSSKFRQVPSSKFRVPSSEFQVPPSSEFQVPPSSEFQVLSSKFCLFQVPSLLLLYWILFNSTQLLPS